MAASLPFLSEDQFTCSICLDVFSNPVSTPCGHSFCLDCISCYWEGRGGGGGAGGGAGSGAKACVCPLCKQAFRKKPELHINHTLREITEQFKHMADWSGAGLGTESGVGPEAGPGAGPGGGENTHPRHHEGAMPDSVLAEMRSRFGKTTSMDTHSTDPAPPALAPPPPAPGPAPTAPDSASPPPPIVTPTNTHPRHDLPPPYSPPRRYSLSGPADSSPQVPLCPVHLRGLEYFCRSDQVCVCGVCLEREHQGHHAIPAKREWLIKKSQLGITEVELRDLISVRQKKIDELERGLQDMRALSEQHTQEVLLAFSQLVSCVEHSQAQVLEVIDASHRAAEKRVQALIQQVEHETTELRKRMAALGQLAQTEDYLLFLKTFPALSSPPPVRDWSDASVPSELHSGLVLQTVSQMLEDFREGLRKLPETLEVRDQTGVAKTTEGSQLLSDKIAVRPHPKVRRVQEYAADITFDPATAHPRLILSLDGKQVICGERHQPVLDSAERFDRVVCVLGRQGFSTGRHYWEVDVGGKTDWDVGVASSSINRKGKITVSPAHGFWFLSLRDRTDYAFRTEPSTPLPVSPPPRRLGVYVDVDKGTLSFYNVEARCLIYTFQDRFPDTIHPFFSPCTNKSGRNQAPLVICPVSPTH